MAEFLADVREFLGDFSTLLGPPLDPKRVPIKWSSVLRRRRGETSSRDPQGGPLTMLINPTQVQLRMPKRTQKQDTIGGSVFFHFANERGFNNDILQLTMSGTTGNIDPRALSKREGRGRLSTLDTLGLESLRTLETDRDRKFDTTGARDKLLAWANLYQLSIEPILDLEGGVINLVDLSYISALFPKMITLFGFFNAAMEFGELANEPFQRQWSLSMTIVKTEPPLDEIVKHITEHIINASALAELEGNSGIFGLGILGF